MAKKKEVLRPSGEASVVVESPPLAVERPISGGGEECFAGAEVLEVAGEYTRLLEEEEKLDQQLKDLKKKLDARELFLLEGMAAAGTQRLTVNGRTLYQIHDLVVSKGKGVSTEQLVERLGDVGMADLVSETYSAQTLKAAVKEARVRAVEAGYPGKAAFCPGCSSFFDDSRGGIGATCPTCSGNGTESILTTVFCGVPEILHNILYIEPKVKLGCRAS